MFELKIVKIKIIKNNNILRLGIEILQQIFALYHVNVVIYLQTIQTEMHANHYLLNLLSTYELTIHIH